MSIVVIGLNHRTCPIDLLEKVMIGPDSMPKALHGLAAKDDVREAVVLSTCNRTEVYAVVERFHNAFSDIRDFLAEVGGASVDEIASHLYSQHDEAAVGHLFEVAAGLDSAVIGESEILGQVRDAWERAMSEGVSRSVLNQLFRHAVEVGKRARTETAIARSTASVSYAAVEMAREILGTLHGRRVLVVGAGEMGEGVATALGRAGAGDIVVVNRSEARARALADRVGAKVFSLDALAAELSVADVVVSCTGSGEVVIDSATIARARTNASGPLLVVDIALPRDVDPVVGTIEGITLRDLDDLNAWARRGIESRVAEVDQVRSIIGDEIERFVLDQAQRQAAPLVAQLRQSAEKIRTGELERYSGRLSSLTEEQREVVESMTQGILSKLLHAPSLRLREAAGTPQGERLSAAIRDLFDLD